MSACAGCGAALSARATFCPACGAPQQASGDGAALNRWQSVLALMVNPAALVTREFDALGAIGALAISALAFATVSAQAALDLLRLAPAPAAATLAIIGKGALLGSAGVAAMAALAWLCARPFGNDRGIGWCVRAFGLGYGPALVYGLCGLALNLGLGWNTAVSCGVSGLLWALGPLFASVRELTGGRATLAAALATLCGGAMLLAWVHLGVGE